MDKTKPLRRPESPELDAALEAELETGRTNQTLTEVCRADTDKAAEVLRWMRSLTSTNCSWHQYRVAKEVLCRTGIPEEQEPAP